MKKYIKADSNNGDANTFKQLNRALWDGLDAGSSFQLKNMDNKDEVYDAVCQVKQHLWDAQEILKSVDQYLSPNDSL